MQRWASGTSPVPDGVASELAGHLDAKAGEAGALAVRLRRMAPTPRSVGSGVYPICDGEAVLITTHDGK